MQKENAQHPSAKTYQGFVYLPTLTYTGPVTNLAAFCRERKLDAQSMSDLAHRRKSTYKSWTFYQGESEEEQKRLRTIRSKYLRGARGKANRAKQWPGLVHTSGERTGTIVNLRNWCNNRQLEYQYITNVMYGTQRTYRGWELDPTWKK
jgi:hypothetical protein